MTNRLGARERVGEGGMADDDDETVDGAVAPLLLLEDLRRQSGRGPWPPSHLVAEYEADIPVMVTLRRMASLEVRRWTNVVASLKSIVDIEACDGEPQSKRRGRPSRYADQVWGSTAQQAMQRAQRRLEGWRMLHEAVATDLRYARAAIDSIREGCPVVEVPDKVEDSRRAAALEAREREESRRIRLYNGL